MGTWTVCYTYQHCLAINISADFVHLHRFQSDHDYDEISYLNDEAGIYNLERAAVKEAEAQGRNVKVPTGMRGEEDEVDIGYSLYRNLCSDPDKIRKHLDSGVLAQLFAKYQTKLPEKAVGGYHKDGYKFILLGACAMSLGCHIPHSTMSLIRRHYKSVGLMRDALTQMEKALNSRIGFKDGEPYDFGSLGLHDTMAKGGPPKADRIYPHMLNVEAPGQLIPAKVMREMSQQLRKEMDQPVENKYGYDVCGGCGAKDGMGGASLLACGKCKKRKYCGTECQKKHWKLHKQVCEAPTGGKENQVL